MNTSPKRTFGSDFRQFFLRGLVVLLPTVLTLWIAVKAYQFVDTAIAEPINGGIRLALWKTSEYWDGLDWMYRFTSEEVATEVERRTEAGLPAERLTADSVRNDNAVKIREDATYRNERILAWWNSHWFMNLIGLAVAIIAVYIAGRLLGGLIGRRVYRRLEGWITRFPVFKQIYPYVKQIVDFLFSDEKPIKFNRVVLIEYPRKGIWSVGFLTGGTMRSIAQKSGDSVTVFIPSSPTPFTGYTLTIPRDEVVELPISVEEAIRFAVSGGVLVPDHQQIGPPSTPSALEEAAANAGLIPLPVDADDQKAPRPPAPSP